MSAIYDNWEKLVAAVLKKEELWQLFHADSISPSISSGSSGFSFCRLSSSIDEVSFPSPDWGASNQKDGNGFGTKIAEPTHSRKRDLKIQVPKLGIEDRGFCRTAQHHRNVSPTPRSRDDAKQESYPLPLPPAAVSNSPIVSPPNSASNSPLPRPESARSPHVSPPSSASNSPLPRLESARSRGHSWKKGKLIGRGPLGNVYLGFSSEKGQMCAMKEVSLSSKDAELKNHARMLEKEIVLLSGINHPNIVQYYGSEMVGDNFYIYFEYVSGGSINMILQQYGRLGESAIRSYTQQILSVLAYLHSKNIPHRDIRGDNVLVDPNGRVKLSNFGIEKHIAEHSLTSWLIDSSYWMAPEVIMKSNVHELAADIWSLGCTVLEMATSRPPLSQYNRVVAMFKIASHKEIPTFPDHLSDVCKDFLRRCLQWDPLHRATASQLLEHPFVKTSSPLGKQILLSTSSATIAVKSEGIDHARNLHRYDSVKGASSSSRKSKSNFHPSDIYTPRNVSAPVSPVGSPLLQPKSLHLHNRQMSPPPPKSCPPTASKPIIGEIGTTPHPHPNQSMLQQGTFRDSPKHSPNIKIPAYWDPNILRGVFKFS